MNPIPMTPYGFGITVDNVNEALPRGIQLLRDVGVKQVSRGIETIEVPGPVSTLYRRPWERVLFDPVRDANPFFHLMESMWILAGSNTAALPTMFLKSYGDFSDDGETFHGAYGYRLRNHFGRDQLLDVIDLLRTKPDTRQAVLGIWDPAADMGATTKDMPCNDMVMFLIRDGRLNMTVCNRSNDAIWGAYGANAVQFSYIQEFVAGMVGVDIGYYVQQSNSFHAYPSNPYWKAVLAGETSPRRTAGYSDHVTSHPLLTTRYDGMRLLEDAATMCLLAELGSQFVGILNYRYRSTYFRDVVLPVAQAYFAYKQGDFATAFNHAQKCESPDWRIACCEWLYRRRAKAEASTVAVVEVPAVAA